MLRLTEKHFVRSTKTFARLVFANEFIKSEFLSELDKTFGVYKIHVPSRIKSDKVQG